MSRKSIVFLISSLLIFTAVLSGCREDNPDTPTFIPDPCKVGDTYLMDIYKMKGNVVQSSLGPIIIPADTLPYRTYTGIMSAIRPLNKDEIAGGAEVVNLSPYIGQEVVFSGRVMLTPYTQDTILIDGRSIIAGIHPMNITIDSSKASRSGEEEIDPCPTPTE